MQNLKGTLKPHPSRLRRVMTGLMSGYHGCTCHGCICHGCTSFSRMRSCCHWTCLRSGSSCDRKCLPSLFFWKSLGLMPLLVLYLGSTCLSVDLVVTVVRCFQWAQACLNLAMYNDEGRDYAKNLATKLGRPFA